MVRRYHLKMDQMSSGWANMSQQLNQSERNVHIASLAAEKPETRNVLRLTEDYASISAS
jgi:hypothetical protein